MTLVLPVTGTSLSRCYRDANVVITRWPLAMVVGFKGKKGFVDYTMEWAVDSMLYQLCAVVCQGEDANYWTMADGGEAGWQLFHDDRVTRIVDMNTLVTKDAVLLMYKKRR